MWNQIVRLYNVPRGQIVSGIWISWNTVFAGYPLERLGLQPTGVHIGVLLSG